MLDRLYPLIRAATLLYARSDLALERVVKALQLGVEGLLGAALSSEEKAELTIALYGLQPRRHSSVLADWEVCWYADRLPPAPARLLLAAAGSGRELLPLVAAGYSVDAFEPSPAHAAELAAHAGRDVETARGSFGELIAAALHDEVNALSKLARRRYDAVILGWGSFTHVLDADERADLLRVCDKLAGQGPVLASFWLQSSSDTRSRAVQLGALLGQRLAALRGLTEAPPPGQIFRTHCGFVHPFGQDEVEALAAAVGRRVEWGFDGYPHVTLLKRK